MKKIGEGWQYTVYDLGNGRVLKKFHSLPKMVWVILKDIFPFQVDLPWEIPGFAKEMKEKAKSSFEAIHQRAIPPEWIGNPTFFSGLDFEQDKVLPLSDALKKADVVKAKEIIDAFIQFNQRCIAHSFMDKSFNITKNYGLAADGNIVLIDIGELVVGPEEINKQLRKKIWCKPYVADCIESQTVREYFLEQMDGAFAA